MPPSRNRGRVALETCRCMGLAALLLVSAIGAARAQETTRLRLAVHGPAATSALHEPTAPRSFAADSVERPHPVAHGAKLGALIGTMAGLAYTVVLNTKKSCTESQGVLCPQDEKDYSTLLMPIYGAGLGAAVGALIGAARR